MNFKISLRYKQRPLQDFIFHLTPLNEVLCIPLFRAGRPPSPGWPPSPSLPPLVLASPPKLYILKGTAENLNGTSARVNLRLNIF